MGGEHGRKDNLVGVFERFFLVEAGYLKRSMEGDDRHFKVIPKDVPHDTNLVDFRMFPYPLSPFRHCFRTTISVTSTILPHLLLISAYAYTAADVLSSKISKATRAKSLLSFVWG